MAANLYHESRGEPVLGSYAVAFTTMERAGHDPAKVCKTVAAPKQFSWTIKGLRQVRGQYVLAPAYNPKDLDAWNRSLVISSIVINRSIYNFIGRTTHYHAASVRPRWAGSMRRVRRLGNHIFYADAKSAMRK